MKLHILYYRAILVISTLLFFGFWDSYKAQTNDVDSLINLMNETQGERKIDLLNDISWSLKSQKPQLANSYCNKAIAYAKEIEYGEGEALALFNLSVLHSIQSNLAVSDSIAYEAIAKYKNEGDLVGVAKCWNILGLNQNTIGNYESATNFFHKSLNVFKEVNNEEYILKLEANIGNIYYNLGRFDKALEAYKNLVDYALNKSDTNLLIQNLGNTALVYSKNGEYKEALEIFFKSLEIARNWKDSSQISTILNHIAVTYFDLEMSNEMVEVLHEAIAINKSLGNDFKLGGNYTNLGNAFKLNHSYDSAHYYYNKALNKKRKYAMHESGVIYTNIGVLHMNRGNLDSASYFIKQGLELNVKYGREEDIAKDRFNLGSVYLMQNELELAEPLLLEAYEYLKNQSLFKDLMLIAENIATLYKEKGNTELALKYQLIFAQAQDSIFSREKQVELTRLLLEEDKKRESVFNQDNNSFISNRKQFMALLFLIVIVTLLFGFTTIQRKKKIRLLQGEISQKERELAFVSLSAVQKDKFIQKFTNSLLLISKNQPDNNSLVKVLKDIKLQNLEINSWEKFKSTFERLAPHFFDKLLNNYPSITDKELRLCAMIRLNIPSNEISQLLGISLSSVNMARYRLRKRLQVTGKNGLEKLIHSI